MNIIETRLPGVMIIEPKVFGDHRGFFKETFQIERYREGALNCPLCRTITRGHPEAFCGACICRKVGPKESW